MANFIVDIGNTAVKAAWSDGMTIGKTFRYQGEKVCDFIVSLIDREMPEVMLICSPYTVSAADRERYAALCHRLVVLDPSDGSCLEKLSLPSYLSYDRAASVVACRHLFKGRPCTIFDMGTTFKIDMLDSDGAYAGGRISPGCRTRLRSLNRYSRSLPLVEMNVADKADKDSLENSIASGVVTGMEFEIEGYIDEHPLNTVVFTGGEAIYFEKKMKTSIFAICNLVFMGLALIADGYVE